MTTDLTATLRHRILSEVSPLLPNATKIPDSHRLSIYPANPQDDVSSTRWTAITTAS